MVTTQRDGQPISMLTKVLLKIPRPKNALARTS